MAVCLFSGAMLSAQGFGLAWASQSVEAYPTSDDLDDIDPNFPGNTAVGFNNAPQTGISTAKPVTKADMDIAALQVLLDREGFSPGAINGLMSDYLIRIVELYEQRSGIRQLSGNSEAVGERLFKSGGEAFFQYTLTAEDIAGPFLADLPKRIQDQRGLGKLDYLSVQEAIAERFHMDEVFLKSLNPEADFNKVGTIVKVANVGRPLDKWVGHIRADKKLRLVTTYDQKGRILGVYPASIGSAQMPSPKGVFKVRNKAGFPAYTLSPENGFERLDDGQQVVIAPGPNNPVGTAWIGLSEKTYGIHGTPEPSHIGLTESHGCIRLTNWDAMELARLVRTGVEVVID